MSSKCFTIFKSQKPVQIFSKIHFLSYLLSLPVDVIAVVVVAVAAVVAAVTVT